MSETRRPAGGVYDWYQRGLALLREGNAAAAAQLLGHACDAEPASRSIREALARAQHDSGQVRAAVSTFESLVQVDPADDYAHFGLGLALRKLGDHTAAHGHLAMAAAMRPELDTYTRALERTRRTLRAREESDDAAESGRLEQPAESGLLDEPE